MSVQSKSTLNESAECIAPKELYSQDRHLTPASAAGTQAQTYPAHGSPAVKLSIVMAAHNEARTITHAVVGLLNIDLPCDFELIVIDDGSTDDTLALLSAIRDPRLRVHCHARNLGKGAALLLAISVATGTHLLPFDADLEYVPEDIPRIVAPVLKGRCSVVYGARLFGCNTAYHSCRYAVGNRVLTLIANVLFDSYLSDLHTCLKLVPLPMLRALSLRQTGFGLDTEITANLLRRGIRPFEVPISYYGRSRAQGKKITWRDAVTCLRILLQARFSTSPPSITETYLEPSVGEQAAVANSGSNEQADLPVLLPGAAP